MNEKILDNSNLVHYVINTYYPQFRKDEDIYQLGLIGLWKALQTYDETKNIKFNTYTARCIRNEINAELERMNAKKRQLDKEGVCVSLNNENEESDDITEEWIQNVKSTSIMDNPLHILQIKELAKEQDKRTKFIFANKLLGHKTEAIADALNVSGQTVRRTWNSLEKEVRAIVAN